MIIGVVTWFLVLIAGSAAVKPGEDFKEPIIMILGLPIYAVMANLAYRMGPMVDAVVAPGGSPRKALFKAGYIFSVVLTALPGAWALMAWLMTVVTGKKL